MKSGRMFGIVAGIAILALAQFQIALADEDSWSTGGPYGTYAFSIAIHPFDNQRIYMGDIQNGLWQTTDGGADWFLMENDTLKSMVWEIKIHPLGPDTIYTCGGRGMFKSTDAGQSWYHLTPNPPYPTGAIKTIEINPGIPSIIYASSNSLHRSTDGGRSWARIDDAYNVENIKADPQNPNIVYAGTGSAEWGDGIMKSTDYGETWFSIQYNIDSTWDIYGRDVAIDPVDPEIIYFATWNWGGSIGKCLYKLDGDHWIDITPPGLTRFWIHNVEVSPLAHNTVFVATCEDGVFRSTDGGLTWEAINQGLPTLMTNPLVIDSTTGTLYLGLYPGGIYRSTNNGDNWEDINHNIAAAYCTDLDVNSRNSDTLYTATKAGLYISTDGAESWMHVDINLEPNIFPSEAAVDPYDPSYIYLPCYRITYSPPYEGVFNRSSDGGATWESFASGLPSDIEYTEIAVADYYGSGFRRLFMGTWEGVYRSEDLGESWTFCGGGPNLYIDDVKVSPANPDVVITAEDTGTGPGTYDLWKSQDGGFTWQNIRNNLPETGAYIGEIACDPVDADIIYLSEWYGSPPQMPIFKSIDGGQTWTDISNNLPRPGGDNDVFCIFGIAINPLNHNNVFVGSSMMGMFQSHDGGQSWEAFNEGLRIGRGSVTTVIDPTDTSKVMMAQFGNSVWSITRTPTGIDDDRNHILPVAFSASSYPNPFNPSATIEYSLPEEASVTMEVYDLLGRKVETLVSRDQRAGVYRVVWDARDRASGLYFYKISADDSFQMGKMILLK